MFYNWGKHHTLCFSQFRISKKMFKNLFQFIIFQLVLPSCFTFSCSLLIFCDVAIVLVPVLVFSFHAISVFIVLLLLSLSFLVFNALYYKLHHFLMHFNSFFKCVFFFCNNRNAIFSNLWASKFTVLLFTLQIKPLQ